MLGSRCAVGVGRGTLGVVGRVAHVDGMPVVRALLLLLRRALVDGGLHLRQHVVDRDEVILGPEAGHWRQIIVLRQGSRSVGYAGSDAETRRVAGHDLRTEFSCVQRGVNRHQGPTDLVVVAGIDLAALDTTEEGIELVEAPLTAVVERCCLMIDVVLASIHGWWLLVVERLVGLRLVCVVATMPVRMRLTIGGLVSTHGTIVVIVA